MRFFYVVLLCVMFLGACSDSDIEGFGEVNLSVDELAAIKDPSTRAFAKNVYPILSGKCGSCHDSSQPPYFASRDIEKAYEASQLITVGKVIDPTHSANSRVVTKLIEQKHQCWTKDQCPSNAESIRSKIARFASEIGINEVVPVGAIVKGPEVVFPATIPVSLSDNITPATYATLTWDLSSIAPGVSFRIRIQDYNADAYRLRSPEFVVPVGTTIHVKDIRFLINGVLRTNESTYSLIDQDVVGAAAGVVISNVPAFILKDKTVSEIKATIQFAQLVVK